MKKNAAFSLYMSLWAVWLQYLFFGNDICCSAPVVAICSMCFWLITTGSRRWFNITMVIFVHFCFVVLLLYHQFFRDALTLSTLQNQYEEGISALGKTRYLEQLTIPVIAVILNAIAASVFLYRHKLTAMSYRGRFCFLIPLLILAAMNHYYYNKEEFSPYEFNAKAKFFGYPAAWLYELTTYSDAHTLQKRLNEPEQIRNFADFANIPSADNIYIIQFESLDYSAVESGAMPFLQKMASKAMFYQIKPHSKKSSANSDFAVLTLKSIYEDSFSVIYKIVQPEYYKTHDTLPQLMKKQGYTTYFYHGNSGLFFNRRPHIEKMGFDYIFFEEDLKQRFTTDKWGIVDDDMATLITEQPQRGKNLHFWITLSSHFDFSIGKKYMGYTTNPKNLRDLYLNSVNYTDGALQKLFESAPQNSIFIIYSDHDSDTDSAYTTVFMVYHKQQDYPHRDMLRVGDIPQIIRQLTVR